MGGMGQDFQILKFVAMFWMNAIKLFFQHCLEQLQAAGQSVN